jgi:hypothetical protein
MKEVKLKSIRYSIIVLLDEVQQDFHKFLENIYNSFSLRQVAFEIIVITNGTGAMLKSSLNQFKAYNDVLKIFAFNNKTCQSVCLKAGLKQSKGEIIIVCGSYQELTTESFNKLIDSLDDETDIITPWRELKASSISGYLRSKIFNAMVRKMIRTDLHDFSCMVRIFRRQVFETTAFYGNMYRYLPILAKAKGFRTKEVKCEHYKNTYHNDSLLRESGLLSNFLDILVIYFNTRFTRKPLRFFSAIGVFFLLIGLIISSYVFAQKFLFSYAIGDRPLLFVAILLMVLGVQAASVGLLGEILVFTHSRHRKEYTIEKII